MLAEPPFSSPEPLGLICNRPVDSSGAKWSPEPRAPRSFPYHVTKKRRALGTRMCLIGVEFLLTNQRFFCPAAPAQTVYEFRRDVRKTREPGKTILKMVGILLCDSDLERLKQENARLRCLLCEHLLREPVRITCGHTFCRSCVDSTSDHFSK